MPTPSDPRLLLQLFQERDIWLFFALFVIGALYFIAASAEGRIDDYFRANPGAKAMYDAWLREQAGRKPPTGAKGRLRGAYYCRKHGVPEDECASKHQEDE